MMTLEEALKQFVLNNIQDPNCPEWVKELAKELGIVQQQEPSQPEPPRRR